jgi:hypothetical protein
MIIKGALNKKNIFRKLVSFGAKRVIVFSRHQKWFENANSRKNCTTHGGGALHNTPHKFGGANLK